MEISSQHYVGIEVMFGLKRIKLKSIKNGRAILEDDSVALLKELNVIEGHARFRALIKVTQND